MGRLFRRAIRDLHDNRFLSTATITTIALAVLTVGTFGLVFFNAEALLNTWKSGMRLMIYLQADTNENARLKTRHHLESLKAVKKIRFIPKEEALRMLTEQLKRQVSLLEGLNRNPLPDAFEVSLDPNALSPKDVEAVAAKIETLSTVASVEYGEEWFQRFTGIFNLLKMGGYVLGSVLTFAAVLIVANTIRIVLYTRKEEIDIMRLVGANDGFIKWPFYLQGIIQGALGSLMGLALLYIGFRFVSSQIQLGFTAGLFSLRFLSIHFLYGIFMTGMVAGWAGSFISLNHFLKD